jgi:hypothetical protein
MLLYVLDLVGGPLDLNVEGSQFLFLVGFVHLAFGNSRFIYLNQISPDSIKIHIAMSGSSIT